MWAGLRYGDHQHGGIRQPFQPNRSSVETAVAFQGRNRVGRQGQSRRQVRFGNVEFVLGGQRFQGRARRGSTNQRGTILGRWQNPWGEPSLAQLHLLQELNPE